MVKCWNILTGKWQWTHVRDSGMLHTSAQMATELNIWYINDSIMLVFSGSEPRHNYEVFAVAIT